jgi:hypothetical protein
MMPHKGNYSILWVQCSQVIAEKRAEISRQTQTESQIHELQLRGYLTDRPGGVGNIVIISLLPFSLSATTVLSTT